LTSTAFTNENAVQVLDATFNYISVAGKKVISKIAKLLDENLLAVE